LRFNSELNKKLEAKQIEIKAKNRQMRIIKKAKKGK